MPVVPPSTPSGVSSPSDKPSTPADPLNDHQPVAAGASGECTIASLNSEEMALLVAFFELLQAWDEDQKIV